MFSSLPGCMGYSETVSLDNCVDVMNAITEETPCTCEFFAQHDEGGGGCESHMECTFIGYLTGLWKACVAAVLVVCGGYTHRSFQETLRAPRYLWQSTRPFSMPPRTTLPCHRGRLFHATTMHCGQRRLSPRQVSCVQSKTVLHLMGQSCTWPEQLRTGQSTQSTASNGPS
jgi:hypothetical protein